MKQAGHGRTRLKVRVGEIAGRYADLAIGHWRTLLILTAMGWVVFAGVEYLQATVFGWQPDDLITLFDFDLLPVAFITAATAHAVLWGRPGEGAVGSMSVALQAFVSILAVTVLVRLAVLLGFLFLVLPGIAISVLLGLSAVIMMAERPGILASLTQSVQRVWSAIGPVIGGYVVYVLSLVGLLFGAVIVSSVLGALMPGPWSETMAFALLSAVLSVSHTVFAVAVYQVLAEASRAEPTVH